MNGFVLSIVTMSTKLQLKQIPVSPNDDYRAGSDGRIYSRTRYAGFGRKGLVDWYALTGHEGGRGYFHVSLCHKNKKVTKAVHRLVCMAFHGMPPSPSYQVRHLDGNRQNNVPSNLRWGTQVENWADRRVHGTATIGEKHWASKLSDEERGHIRYAVTMGLCSRRHAARVLGMSQSAISELCRGLPIPGCG